MSQHDSSEHTIRLRLNLGALLGNIRVSLQRIIDLVAYGLSSAEHELPPTLGIPGAFISYGTAGDQHLAPDDLRDQFRTWLVGCGLRDAVEEISGFLEEIRRACAAVDLAQQPNLSSTRWNQLFVEQGKKFHRLGLPDKLDNLRQYDPILVPEIVSSVIQINQARNCLVHRNGIVSQRDLNQADVLEVTWKRLELVVGTETEERIVQEGHIVDEGEELFLRSATGSRLFAPGQRVSFSAQEFGEICYTLSLAAQEMQMGLEAFLRKKGIPIVIQGEPDTTPN